MMAMMTINKDFDNNDDLDRHHFGENDDNKEAFDVDDIDGNHFGDDDDDDFGDDGDDPSDDDDEDLTIMMIVMYSNNFLQTNIKKQTLRHIHVCDAIKQNESELENINLKVYKTKP